VGDSIDTFAPICLLDCSTKIFLQSFKPVFTTFTDDFYENAPYQHKTLQAKYTKACRVIFVKGAYNTPYMLYLGMVK